MMFFHETLHIEVVQLQKQAQLCTGVHDECIFLEPTYRLYICNCYGHMLHLPSQNRGPVWIIMT